MNRFSLTHLSHEVLRRELTTRAARENEATAELLAYIAEFDERKLYLPEAYESMLAYCTGELKLSEEAAKKRLWVARAGRGCPGVFEALASGRVHIAGSSSSRDICRPRTPPNCWRPPSTRAGRTSSAWWRSGLRSWTCPPR